METSEYNRLKENDNPLKIDKDLIEIQKTIIYYNEKILKELSDLKKILKDKQKDKLSSKPMDNSFIQQLIEMQIPEGYAGNNK